MNNPAWQLMQKHETNYAISIKELQVPNTIQMPEACHQAAII